MITRLAQAALRMESVAVIKAWSWLETHTHTKTGSLVHFERLVESERKKKKQQQPQYEKRGWGRYYSTISNVTFIFVSEHAGNDQAGPQSPQKRMNRY